MPNKDKTGPEGKGPKTGRGLGDCNNNGTNEQQGLRPRRNARRANSPER